MGVGDRDECGSVDPPGEKSKNSPEVLAAVESVDGKGWDPEVLLFSEPDA